MTNENANGILEFKVKGQSDDDFFPTSVEFESEKTFMDTNVSNDFSCNEIGGEGRTGFQ